ncbi:hypothetical protein E8E13_000004 [Curvularia kusanoi]|uniref:CAF1-domain-containing protein n=1 Tax=Curvularia kusanoi TaxID=90978 RepID=A0A9P4W1R8_CURKU|nr:hypothetical protein E8E13_000004 [Curvularia kusanoi]
MEVDGPSFADHVVRLLVDISKADFVSFDLELSGIPSRLPDKKPRGAGPLTMEDRYAETREGANRYQILQIGLTCGKFDYLQNKCVLQPYNITLSPLLAERLDIEREISFQSGACQFLLGCNFDLGAPFARGVQYLSREEAVRAKRLADARLDKKNTIEDLQLKDTDTDSLDFVRRAREALTAWQKSTATSLEITSCTGLSKKSVVNTISRFEKRLVHQLVRAEFPDAVAIGRQDCIRIIPFDPVREADNTQRLKNRVREQIARQTGFRWIFEALVGGEINPDLLYVMGLHDRDDQRPRFDRALESLTRKSPVLVGHNMFTDIVYLYRTFVGPLPDTLAEFNASLHELFPKIIDTKYLATHDEGDLNANPDLETIARGLQKQPLPDISTHEHHDKYNDLEAFHEAGYDSLLTATIMLRLAAKLGHEHSGVGQVEPKPENEAILQRPLLGREASEAISEPTSEGGIQLPKDVLEDFVTDGREKVQHPVAVPGTTGSSSSGRKTRKAKRKTQKDKKDDTATHRFATKTIFEQLRDLSVQDTGDSPATSDEEAGIDHENLPASDSPDDGSQAPNGSWADERYVQDESGWVPIKTLVRKEMEMIPAFDDRFWHRFGNKLRVYGTEEKEMRIAAWPV